MLTYICNDDRLFFKVEVALFISMDLDVTQADEESRKEISPKDWE